MSLIIIDSAKQDNVSDDQINDLVAQVKLAVSTEIAKPEYSGLSAEDIVFKLNSDISGVIPFVDITMKIPYVNNIITIEDLQTI